MWRVANRWLGIVDDDNSIERHELVNAPGESKSYRLTETYGSAREIAKALSNGDLNAGLVVPYDYNRNLRPGGGSTVQFLQTGVNANTAAISQGYAESVIQSYKAKRRNRRPSDALPHGAASQLRRGFVSLQPALLYNPGLKGSWFLVTGVFGLLRLLNASPDAASECCRDRDC